MRLIDPAGVSLRASEIRASPVPLLEVASGMTRPAARFSSTAPRAGSRPASTDQPSSGSATPTASAASMTKVGIRARS